MFRGKTLLHETEAVLQTKGIKNFSDSRNANKETVVDGSFTDTCDTTYKSRKKVTVQECF